MQLVFTRFIIPAITEPPFTITTIILPSARAGVLLGLYAGLTGQGGLLHFSHQPNRGPKDGGKHMSGKSSAVGTGFAACSGVLLSLALSACSGGHASTMTAQSEGQMAEERLTTQTIAGITSTESSDATVKRHPEAPIYVKLAPVSLDTLMRRADKPTGTITQHLRNEFASDPIIQLLPEPKKKPARKASLAAPGTADVEVVSAVSLQEMAKLGEGPGKAGKTIHVVFKATITSHTPAVTYTVSESGHFLQRMAVSKRFASQIREIIVEKIGPEIPAR